MRRLAGGMVISMLILVLGWCELCAQRTTRRNLRSTPQVQAVAEACDTIFAAADSTAFAFNGYEKALRSSRESFFVTNRSDSLVDHLSLELTYMDMQGRMLDRRTVELDLELKPGETRKADIRSWDTQKVMYYHRSPRPRSDSQATPYRLRIRLLSAIRRK